MLREGPLLVNRILSSECEELTGDYRKVLNETFLNLNLSTDIIRIIERKTIKLTGHQHALLDKKYFRNFN